MPTERTDNKRDWMERILEVRYTDLEEERALCEKLLDWAEKSGDRHAIAFAHVYLGDYYVAQNDAEHSGVHLLEGKRLAEEGAYLELQIKSHALLGLHYELLADEQSAVECYLQAITVARRVGDQGNEAIVLNNLAYALQRHGSYAEALEYYREAYRIERELNFQEPLVMVLSNLAEISIILGRTEEARAYIEECEGLEVDEGEKRVYQCRNWCGYHAARGEREAALRWADRALELESDIIANRLSAFELFTSLCRNMMGIGSGEYALRFLRLMEKCGEGGGLDQLQMLEKTKAAYCLAFEPEERHGDAYRKYYQKTTEYACRNNEIIVNGMKARTLLDQVLHQQENLRSQQETLERQANLDELTGVFNRRYLQILMERRDGVPGPDRLGVVMLDVDYFKEYNDFYGHLAGDDVLRAVGECLRGFEQERVSPCRFGGDEFVCLCEGMDDGELLAYIRRVQDALERRNILHEKSPCSGRVTLSIGYANEPAGEGAQPYLLMELADQALYEAKRCGRNSFRRKGAKEL